MEKPAANLEAVTLYYNGPMDPDDEPDADRRAISVMDKIIHSGFSRFVEPKFSSRPEIEVTEGRGHLVVCHGFKAGGHTYTLVLRQES